MCRYEGGREERGRERVKKRVKKHMDVIRENYLFNLILQVLYLSERLGKLPTHSFYSRESMKIEK